MLERSSEEASALLLYQPGLGGGDPRVIRLGSGGLSSHVALCSVHTTGFGWAGLMVRQPQIIVLAALLKVGIPKILEIYSLHTYKT